MGQNISLLWSSRGSSRPLTAVSARWKSAIQACNGWWHYGLTVTWSPISSTWKWFGLFQLCHHCKSPILLTPKMPGSCGAVWERINRRRITEERRWKMRILLILRRWWGSRRGWRATSTDTSGWIYQREAWTRCPQHSAQPSAVVELRYHLTETNLSKMHKVFMRHFQHTHREFKCCTNICFLLFQITNSKYMITTLTLLTECALLKMPTWVWQNKDYIDSKYNIAIAAFIWKSTYCLERLDMQLYIADS